MIISYATAKLPVTTTTITEKLTIRQGVLSLAREDLLKRVDFDSQSQSAWECKRIGRIENSGRLPRETPERRLQRDASKDYEKTERC
jgi:hypothetical protein